MKTYANPTLQKERTDAYKNEHARTNKLLTINEVIQYLNVSRTYFYTNLIEEIPAIFLDKDKRTRRYDMTAVQGWLKQVNG